jgi:hypothetical protein
MFHSNTKRTEFIIEDRYGFKTLRNTYIEHEECLLEQFNDDRVNSIHSLKRNVFNRSESLFSILKRFFNETCLNSYQKNILYAEIVTKKKIILYPSFRESNFCIEKPNPVNYIITHNSTNHDH